VTDDDDDDGDDDIPLIVIFPLAVREPAHNNPCGLLLYSVGTLGLGLQFSRRGRVNTHTSREYVSHGAALRSVECLH
jgi:hypothetical protein